MAPNYRSLIGGFYSSTPMDKSSGPVSIRMNNPGAVNGASWLRDRPGYVTEIETTKGNFSTVFETPEHGVAVWYELMNRYSLAGTSTVGKIIQRYGGGQDYSGYVADVVKRTGLPAGYVIKLVGDDLNLLKFAKAMFRHEAGEDTPLSDAQILYGFNFAREYARTGKAPIAPIAQSGPQTIPQPLPTQPPYSSGGIFAVLWAIIQALFGGKKPVTTQRILRSGDEGPDVRALQVRLKEIGFTDILIDGEFGEVTETAVRKFQTSSNIDPDGEVGPITLDRLNSPNATAREDAPLLPPKHAGAPEYYLLAEKDIGFHETGVNRGIEHFIASAKTGSLGDPYCAIWVNAKIEDSGLRGSRSAAARSFEKSEHFVRLAEPALGAVVTMWRKSPSSGLGHVFFYDGESSKGVRGIGANEDDQIKRSFHERSRITGYYWPKLLPLPTMGKIVVGSEGDTAGSEV